MTHASVSGKQTTPMMRARDTFDVMCSVMALVADAAAFIAAYLAAYWIRFHSGLIPVEKGFPPVSMYVLGALVTTILHLVIFRSQHLYKRPQSGSFVYRIPRIVKACAMGLLVAVALASFVRTDHEYSRWVIALSCFTVTGFILIERGLMFGLERYLAARQCTTNYVAILGVNETAAELGRAFEREPRLRARVVAYLRTQDTEDVHEGISPDLIRGHVDDFHRIISYGGIDQVVLADTSLPRDAMVDLIVACEKNLVRFSLVPDMFRMLTNSLELQDVEGLPVLGMGPWPLDHVTLRLIKRCEDIAGALVGLLLSLPIVTAAALAIKASSRGPIFYKQERCGLGGKQFSIYKLRTMRTDAEAATGPVWAKAEDPRRTRVGTFLRAYNLDELPQFWNVLKGDMSLVGPRPERPAFVEQFRNDLERYMWRHVSKPGMTGWAQVNGLRGNTCIRQRIKFDLYYLEYWSLAFDFKIMIKTFFSQENAY